MIHSPINPVRFLSQSNRGMLPGLAGAPVGAVRLVAVLAACGLVAGCGRSTPTAGTAPAPATVAVSQPEAAAGPQAPVDLDKVVIPDAAASGTLFGRPFQPDQVAIVGKELVFREGSRFAGDHREIRMTFDPKAEPRAKATLRVAERDNNPPVNVLLHSYQVKGSETTQRAFGDGYALRIEFGEPKDGRLPGRIFLRIADEGQAHSVSGTFDALDVRNDPGGEPPGAGDAPYVYGLLNIQAKGEGAVGAGYVGRTDSGKELSDQVGWRYGPSAISGGVGSTTHAPRVSYLSIDKGGAYRYSHTRLEPGRYLVYAQWENAPADWRWVDVTADTRLRLDLRIDPARLGSLEVSVAGKPAQGDVSVVPLNEKGELPYPAESVRSLAFWLHTTANLRDGKAAFKALPPGRYRVTAGMAKKDVDVQTGKTATVELR